MREELTQKFFTREEVFKQVAEHQYSLYMSIHAYEIPRYNLKLSHHENATRRANIDAVQMTEHYYLKQYKEKN